MTVPTSIIDVDAVDPSEPITMAYQHCSNQGIGHSSAQAHTTLSGGAGTSRPRRTRRSRSRSRTPPKQYRHRSRHFKSGRDKSPDRSRHYFSDSDNSDNSSDHTRRSRKRRRSPSSSRSPRRTRRSRREGSSFMYEMKELMSSMIGEQIRAALPATAVTRSVIPTTASVVFGYGDGTQTSATIGDAPMTVASHAHGTMATHVTSQVATVLDETLPPLPSEVAPRVSLRPQRNRWSRCPRPTWTP